MDNTVNSLVIHGSTEVAEVLNDEIREVTCQCGHIVKIGNNTILNGGMAAMTIGSNKCPNCGNAIN